MEPVTPPQNVQQKVHFYHIFEFYIFFFHFLISHFFKGIESLVTNSSFLSPMYLQPDVANLLYFKLRLFDPTQFIV